MRDQAERFGARFLTDNATRVEPATEEGGLHTVWVGDEAFQARTVILAMGAEHKKLGVPGEEELANGRGVSYCATCDAAFFKDRETIIVGGGDSAMEEAIFLAKFSSKVTIVHRRDEFRASQIMLDRARAIDEHRAADAVRRRGVPGRRGRRARLGARCATSRPASSASSRWPARSSRSATSRSRRSWPGIVDTDEDGYVAVEGRSTRTNVPGVFAAGDLVDHTYRQAVTAAGSGCQAALDAEWYLRDNPPVPTPDGARGHRRPRRGPVGPPRACRAPVGARRAQRARST